MEEHVQSAKRELGKLTQSGMGDQAIMKKATLHLDKSMRAIAWRQKHIKIADRSDLGWQVVAAYESDEVTSDFEDEGII